MKNHDMKPIVKDSAVKKPDKLTRPWNKYRGHDITIIGVGMYLYSHVDFDGAVDAGDCRGGCGKSVEDCESQIDEYWKSIDWVLGKSETVIGNDWASYPVSGEDENGHEYYGMMQTFISQPKIIPDEIEDIQND